MNILHGNGRVTPHIVAKKCNNRKANAYFTDRHFVRKDKPES